jgi:hypothetical protein
MIPDSNQSQDLHDFSCWAFGRDYKDIGINTMIVRWNIKHGKLYRVPASLRGVGDQEKVINKMKMIWLNSVSKDRKEK